MSAGLQREHQHVRATSLKNRDLENSRVCRSTRETNKTCLSKEDLRLECLEQGSPATLEKEQNLVADDLDRQSIKCWDSTNQQANDFRKPLVDDVFARGDFTVYQPGNVIEFFRETIPRRVSEVCLVNDHYILVKMPETCWRRSSQIDCIIEEVNTESEVEAPANKQDLLASQQHNDGRVGKFWQHQRNRRVCPMKQGSMDTISTDHKHEDELCKSSNHWSVHGGEKEIFQTRTKIKGSLLNTKPVNSPATKIERDSAEQTQRGHPPAQHVYTQEADKVVGVHAASAEAAVFGTSLEVSSIRSPYVDWERENRSLKTSLHDKVLLESHGFVVTPVNTLQNGRLVEVYETAGILNSTQSRLKVRRNFSAIRWLLKPFHARAKSKKQNSPPKPKINAVVYKTYFVRWKKPPDLSVQEYDVNCEGNEATSEMPVLRRCRSAIF